MKKLLAIFLMLALACTVLVACNGDTSDEEVYEASISEEEYRASCEEIGYKELCRNPDDYEGRKIRVVVKIAQIMDSDSGQNQDWRAYTDDEDGLGLYFGDEYYLSDKREEGSTKILEDDILVIYGEFTGLKKISRAFTNTQDELPCITVRYAELVENKTFEELFEEYSQKLRDSTPTLIDEYNAESANNDDGIEGLAELSNEKIEKLAAISTEGVSKMAALMYQSSDNTIDEYEEWASKLQDVYMEEAQKITQAYMDSAT